MNNALIVRNVSKTFDKFKLDNISFEVPGGSIVGVIGKNGCGKSTLLSVLMGMKESDSTDTGIVIDGVCLQKDEKEYKKKIAYVFSELPFIEKISAVSIGKYYGRYYDGFNQKKYEALLKQYGLIDFPGVPLRISKSKNVITIISELFSNISLFINTIILIKNHIKKAIILSFFILNLLSILYNTLYLLICLINHLSYFTNIYY